MIKQITEQLELVIKGGEYQLGLFIKKAKAKKKAVVRNLLYIQLAINFLGKQKAGQFKSKFITAMKVKSICLNY